MSRSEGRGYEGLVEEGGDDLRHEIPLCEREAEVAEAVSHGMWTEELSRHVASCRACTDVALVAKLFEEEAAAALEEASRAVGAAGRLPPAAAIWRRARQADRRQALRRALSPIRWMERLGTGLAVGVAAVIAWWTVSSGGSVAQPLLEPLRRGMGRIAAVLKTSVTPSAADGAGSGAPPGVVALGLVALVLAMLAGWVYRWWAHGGAEG